MQHAYLRRVAATLAVISTCVTVGAVGNAQTRQSAEGAPPAVQAQLRAYSASLGDPQTVPPAPAADHWIAFDAAWRTTSPRSTVVGRYYQGADGSTRTDSGPDGGPIMVVSISNVSTNLHYEFIRGQWSSFPMRLPATGYRPVLRAPAVTEGLQPWTDKIHGYDLYRFTSPGGVVRFEAPALNFFALRVESGDTRQEFSDIVVHDQSPDIFMPPVDASVEPHPTEVRGIATSP